VDEKLSIASSAPNEQRVKARSVRGLKSPECKAEFFFIISSFLTPILRGLLFLFEGNRSDSRTAEIAPHGDLLRVARSVRLNAVFAAAIVCPRGDQRVARGHVNLQCCACARAGGFDAQLSGRLRAFSARDCYGVLRRRRRWRRCRRRSDSQCRARAC